MPIADRSRGFDAVDRELQRLRADADRALRACPRDKRRQYRGGLPFTVEAPARPGPAPKPNPLLVKLNKKRVELGEQPCSIYTPILVQDVTACAVHVREAVRWALHYLRVDDARRAVLYTLAATHWHERMNRQLQRAKGSRVARANREQLATEARRRVDEYRRLHPTHHAHAAHLSVGKAIRDAGHFTKGIKDDSARKRVRALIGANRSSRAK